VAEQVVGVISEPYGQLAENGVLERMGECVCASVCVLCMCGCGCLCLCVCVCVCVCAHVYVCMRMCSYVMVSRYGTPHT